MMRIIRILNMTKRNPCIFQNLHRYKAPVQQAIKIDLSTDALKERLNEENLHGSKKVNAHDERDMYDDKLPNERKKLSESHLNLPKEFTSNILYQNKDALLKLIPNMSPSNAVEFMKSLCSSRTRSLDLLNALSGKFQSNPPSNLIECSAILYCSAVLNFRDLNLIRKIGEQIISNKSEFASHKLPVNIMRSLGVLKYDDQELLEVLMGTILYYKTEIPEDLVTSLTTLAIVNAETPYTKALIQLLSNYQEVDYSHPEAYLNFVWSCIILNELNVSHISRVLSTDFISKVLDSDKPKTNLLKLQNIHGAASFLAKSYNGPLLKEYNLSLPAITKSRNQFLESLKNGLYYICPKEGFLKFNVDTEAGFLIDVKCNVSPQGEIVRLKKNDTNFKVGLILLDYHDFCLGSEKMTGLNTFKVRILQAKGYKTLLIPYTEFSPSARLSVKIDYLREKFRSIV